MSQLVLLLSLVFGVSVACRPKPAATDAQPNFAIENHWKDSFLLDLRDLRDNTLRLCIRVPSVSGTNAEVEKDVPEKLRATFETVVNTWDKALREALKGWPNRSAIKVVSTCERKDVSIMWGSNARELAAIAGGMDSTAAAVQVRLITVNESQIQELMREAGGFSYATPLMHEFGHLLGLGDTYEAFGYQRGVGAQPRALMRNVRDKPTGGFSEVPTKDDVAGIATLFAALTGNPLTCPDGYRAHKATYSKVNTMFCVPSEANAGNAGTAAVSQNGTPIPPPQLWENMPAAEVVLAAGLSPMACDDLFRVRERVVVVTKHGFACGFLAGKSRRECQAAIGNRLYNTSCDKIAGL